MHRRLWLAIAVTAYLGTGCGLFGGKPSWYDEAEEEFGEPRTTDITLEVVNQNFYDANVYAFFGSHRQRLGTVHSQGAETFTFRWSQSDLRIGVDLVGAGERATPAFSVGPGDYLRVVIDPEGRVHRTR